MLNEKRNLERQRLAWGVMLAAFTALVLTCIAIPLFINATLQNATRPIEVLVQANQGTVGIDDQAGGRRAVLVGDTGQLIVAEDRVLTGNTATALLSFAVPGQEPLAAMQVFSNTDLNLTEADTPRFSVSKKEHVIEMRLENGRIRIDLGQDEERSVVMHIETPQGNVLLTQPGQYAIVVTNEDVQVVVQNGGAVLAAQGSELVLPSGTRGEIPAGSAPLGPLGSERNLVVNNDFSRDLDHWVVDPWIVDLAAQPAGQIRILGEDSNRRLNITRQGIGHADVSVRQSINQDVGGLNSLQLLLNFRIIQQDLGVCGVKGSECPLFLRINYVDENGATNTWQQGFYATGEIDANATPDSCITCAMVQGLHIRVPMQQDYFFEIADFQEELARLGRQPAQFIESVILVSSGHGFEVEVLDVTLLAEE